VQITQTLIQDQRTRTNRQREMSCGGVALENVYDAGVQCTQIKLMLRHGRGDVVMASLGSLRIR
jgi:hypothetical protein